MQERSTHRQNGSAIEADATEPKIPQTNDVELLTIAQAAKRMDVSEAALRDMIAQGEFLTVPWGPAGTQRRIPAWYLRVWQHEKLYKPERRATAIAS